MGVKSDSCETSINATTKEDINSLLGGWYEVDNYRLPSPKNKPSARGDTDQPVYKEYGCGIL